MDSVCWLFIFKDTEPSPLQDSFSVRQQGGLPGPPPVVPDPESIDAQASYRSRHSTIARSCVLVVVTVPDPVQPVSITKKHTV